jgi:hypothetical protein
LNKKRAKSRIQQLSAQLSNALSLSPTDVVEVTDRINKYRLALQDYVARKPERLEARREEKKENEARNGATIHAVEAANDRVLRSQVVATKDRDGKAADAKAAAAAVMFDRNTKSAAALKVGYVIAAAGLHDRKEKEAEAKKERAGIVAARSVADAKAEEDRAHYAAVNTEHFMKIYALLVRRSALKARSPAAQTAKTSSGPSRSPYEAVRSPYGAVRSPYEAVRTPFSSSPAMRFLKQSSTSTPSPKLYSVTGSQQKQQMTRCTLTVRSPAAVKAASSNTKPSMQRCKSSITSFFLGRRRRQSKTANQLSTSDDKENEAAAVTPTSTPVVPSLFTAVQTSTLASPSLSDAIAAEEIQRLRQQLKEAEAARPAAAAAADAAEEEVAAAATQAAEEEAALGMLCNAM